MEDPVAGNHHLGEVCEAAFVLHGHCPHLFAVLFQDVLQPPVLGLGYMQLRKPDASNERVHSLAEVGFLPRITEGLELWEESHALLQHIPEFRGHEGFQLLQELWLRSDGQHGFLDSRILPTTHGIHNLIDTGSQGGCHRSHKMTWTTAHPFVCRVVVLFLWLGSIELRRGLLAILLFYRRAERRDAVPDLLLLGLLGLLLLLLDQVLANVVQSGRVEVLHPTAEHLP
mmetsp:Transcript_25105/g.73344  ORF Transcript_25105/g.73344 Transcript_25105/m.73344 type:complete len:228 (-) Transcript_25105:593-1276(-)